MAADAPAGTQAAPATAITAAASARRPVARREPARVARPARGTIVPAVISAPFAGVFFKPWPAKK
jgi:hypothetical protein